MSRKQTISRRRFLGTGVAASSAVLLNPSLLRAAEGRKSGNGANRPNDITCGIIGIGGRGSGLLEAMNKSAGVRVAALCDIDPDALDRAAEKVTADKPERYTDHRKLIDAKDLDAIFIATPCYLHTPMAIEVLESGRNCYCEKPMGLSVKDVDKVRATARKAKGKFQIGTQLRYGSPWKPALELIASGELGKPIFVRAWRHNGGTFPAKDWFYSREQSGDVILEQAVHEFDIINTVFQGIPERAAGFGGLALREPPGREIRDHFTLSFDYGQGKKCGYTHSWISVRNVGCDGMNEMVYLEKGVVDIHGGKVYYRDDREPTTVDPEPKGDTTQLAVDAFFRCIRDDTKPMCNEETGRNAVLTGLLGRKALDSGEVETMDEMLKNG